MKFINKKFPELSFYVDGERKQFVNGEYEAKSKKEQDIVAKLKGAEKAADKKDGE